MAEMKGTTIGILVRIGSGEPVEVAEVELPMRAVVQREEVVNFGVGRVETSAFIVADWEGLNSDIRAALIGVAEELPEFGPAGEVEADD